MKPRSFFLLVAGLALLCGSAVADHAPSRALAPAPEPGAVLLLSLGILVLGWGFIRRRRYH